MAKINKVHFDEDWNYWKALEEHRVFFLIAVRKFSPYSKYKDATFSDKGIRKTYHEEKPVIFRCLIEEDSFPPKFSIKHWTAQHWSTLGDQILKWSKLPEKKLCKIVNKVKKQVCLV